MHLLDRHLVYRGFGFSQPPEETFRAIASGR
jgi:hypothetical protein